MVALSAFWLLAWSSVWGQGCRAGTRQGRDGTGWSTSAAPLPSYCNKGLRSAVARRLFTMLFTSLRLLPLPTRDAAATRENARTWDDRGREAWSHVTYSGKPPTARRRGTGRATRTAEHTQVDTVLVQSYFCKNRTPPQSFRGRNMRAISTGHSVCLQFVRVRALSHAESLSL